MINQEYNEVKKEMNQLAGLGQTTDLNAKLDAVKKLNREKRYKFDSEDLEFKAIDEIYQEGENNIFELKGFVKSSGGDYGDSYSFITPNGLINAKPNMYEQIIPLYENKEFDEVINAELIYVQFNTFKYRRKEKVDGVLKQVENQSYGMKFLTLEDVLDLEKDNNN